jgi:hypothetical protein
MEGGGKLMRKAAVVGLLTVVAGFSIAIAQGEDPVGVGVSSDRWLGLGLVVSETGSGIGARYWLDPQFAIEGVADLSTWESAGVERYDVGAMLGGLYRVVDGSLVDFLASASIRIDWDDEGLDEVLLSVTGGVEWSWTDFPEVAWSVNAGLIKEFGGGVYTSYVLAVHYYFPPTDRSTAGT